MYWPTEYVKGGIRSGGTEWVRDFIALNCESVRAGVTSAKELKMFRTTHDSFQSKPSKEKRPKSAQRVQDTTFGIQNR